MWVSGIDGGQYNLVFARSLTITAGISDFRITAHLGDGLSGDLASYPTHKAAAEALQSLTRALNEAELPTSDELIAGAPTAGAPGAAPPGAAPPGAAPPGAAAAGERRAKRRRRSDGSLGGN